MAHAETPAPTGDHRPLEAIPCHEAHATGSRQITVPDVVWTLAHLDPIDHFGYQKMQVRIPLPVGMGYQVDRRTVHGNRDVGPVIRIEPAQEDLLRLAAARVLRDHETWNETKQCVGRFAWTQVQIEIADRFGRRRRVGPFGADRDRVRQQRDHANPLDQRAVGRGADGPMKHPLALGAKRTGEEEQQAGTESRESQSGSRHMPSTVHARLRFGVTTIPTGSSDTGG